MGWFKKKIEDIEKINDRLRYKDSVLEFLTSLEYWGKWEDINEYVSNFVDEKSFIIWLSISENSKETEDYLIESYKLMKEKKMQYLKKINKKTKDIKRRLK